jgi:hypothetical protein
VSGLYRIAHISSAWDGDDSPVYSELFAAVRDVNSKLPADARVRVFGGDPGPGYNRSRETAAVSVLKEQALQKQGKALDIMAPRTSIGLWARRARPGITFL